MGSSKPKKNKQTGKPGQSRRPQPADLPVESIPDFDAPGMIAALSAFETTATPLIRHLTAIVKMCDDAKNNRLMEFLAASEQTARLPDLLAESASALQACATLLPALRAPLEAWKQGERRSRKARFERIAANLQWKLNGSWPEPVVEGIVFVTVDETKDRALVNGQGLIAPTAERLAYQVAAELEELMANRTAPADFVASLWRAYQSSGGSAGHGVLVHDLLAELAWQRQSKAFQRDPRENLYRGYSVAQFRADVTHYLIAGSPPMEEAGSRFEVEIVGGSFAQDGIFMYFPNSDRLATCGRITFKLADRGDPK